MTPTDPLQAFFDSIATGRTDIITVAAVIFAVYILRTFGKRWLPWLNTDRGGAVSVLVVGVATALLNLLLSGERFSFSVFLKGAQLGLEAAGGFVVVKRILTGDANVEDAQRAAGNAVRGSMSSTDAAAALESAIAKRRGQ